MSYAGGGQGTMHCNTSQALRTTNALNCGARRGAIVMDDWNVTLHRLETPVQDFIDNDRVTHLRQRPDHARPKHSNSLL